MVAAFALFGMMIGFNASVERIVNGAFPDRVYVYSRFGNGPGGTYSMPLAYRDQILRLIPVGQRHGKYGAANVVQRNFGNFDAEIEVWLQCREDISAGGLWRGK